MRTLPIIALLLFSASVAWSEYLANPSFETPTATGRTPAGIPDTFAYWGYDWAEYRTAENGITPLDGSRMLRFMYSLPFGSVNPSRFGASEIIQLFDLTTLPDYSASTTYRVYATAHFNRVTGDSETDSLFDVTLGGWTGNPVNFPNTYSDPLRYQTKQIESDDNPLTWESITSTIKTQPGMNYLSVRLAAVENIVNDMQGAGTEFDGHYVDKVSLQIVAIPEVSSLALVACILVIGIAMKSRHGLALA